MGQVHWQRSRSASRRANRRPPGRLRPPWDIGLIRHRFDGNSVVDAADRWSCQEIRMFFVFIDFHRKSPPLSWLPRLAAAQCRRRTAPTGKRALAPGNGWLAATARAAPRHATSGQLRTRELRGRATAAALEWMTQVAAQRPPTPFERGMPPRRRGRIPETSGESIFQRIALTRTFYPRCPRRRSRHAGLPPESSAAALKTAPTTL